jgi:sugar lactone lactonase YvrE
VQVFDGEDGPARVVGEKGDMAGYFGQPKGIAIDEHDRLFVVDAHFEAVQLFDEAGVLLMSFGREGREAGEFWLPVGVHVDGRGRVFVADSYNRRVQVFELLAQEIEP